MENSNKNIEFIDMMIPHHQAAIDMVSEYQDSVTNSELKTLMENIVSAQTAEIKQMKKIKADEENKTISVMPNKIIPAELTGKALYDFVVKNESLIYHAKKSEIKRADSIVFSTMFIDEKGKLATKSEVVTSQMDITKLKAVVVINTTNYFDSHMDVHIPGIWKKSLADNKKNGFYLLDSHGREFEDVIAEGCAAETKTMSWKDLGFDMPGTTEALLFTAIIEKDRNEYMFGQYQKGYVKKHSVGMQYVKMVTCINDEDYPVQKENWDRYFPMVANPDDVDDMFWAILEAKIIEGSAVLFASNCMTPMYMMEEMTDSTKNEPVVATQEEPQFDLSKELKTFKFF